MKPVAAVVESAVVRAAKRVDDAFRTFTVADANLRERRLELGRSLVEARALFPATGRNAGGWARFLAERKINRDVALDAMKYAGYVEEHPGEPLPSRAQAGIDKPSVGTETFDDDEPVDVLGQERDAPPFRQMTEGEWIQGLGRLDPDVRRRIMDAARPLPAPAPALSLTPDPTTANVHGGSGERKRGSYCTPRKWAHAVGPFDVDPFSNPRARIAAVDRCMLENGGDGLVVGEPGSYRVGADGAVRVASASTRTWWQPPYERGFIERVVAHYGHTRFCALLRFAPDTAWFEVMWPLVAVIAVPMERIAFETPEGIVLADADEGEDKGAPYPHVFYYSDPRDITDEIAQTCILLNRYEALANPALHIVR